MNTSGIVNAFFGTLTLANRTQIGLRQHDAWRFQADVSSDNLTNATAIGYNTKVSRSNSLILGAGVNVGIGTGAPQAKLQVNGGDVFIGLTVVPDTATPWRQPVHRQ